MPALTGVPWSSPYDRLIDNRYGMVNDAVNLVKLPTGIWWWLWAGTPQACWVSKATDQAPDEKHPTAAPNCLSVLNSFIELTDVLDLGVEQNKHRTGEWQWNGAPEVFWGVWWTSPSNWCLGAIELVSLKSSVHYRIIFNIYLIANGTNAQLTHLQG